MRYLYGIRDNTVNELAPQTFISGHDAHAIRVFQEMASDERMPIARYLDDMDLVKIAALSRIDGAEVLGFSGGRPSPVTDLEVVITGKALRAASQPAGQPELVKEA